MNTHHFHRSTVAEHELAASVTLRRGHQVAVGLLSEGGE